MLRLSTGHGNKGPGWPWRYLHAQPSFVTSSHTRPCFACPAPRKTPLLDAWRAEHGEARQFLQGLIQICAAFHHFQNGNRIGAVELLKRGADKMRRYPHRYMGIDAGKLIAEVDAAHEEVERMRTGKTPLGAIAFPRIELPEAGG